MAIKKSTYTGGMGRPTLHSPYVAHVAAEAIVEHTFREAVGTADILELVVLPAHCKILSAELVSAGTAAITFDVGIMSGKPHSNDPARTVGTQLFAAATPTTAVAAAIPALSALAVASEDRSIGVRPSASVAANSATKLFLRIRYAKGLN